MRTRFRPSPLSSFFWLALLTGCDGAPARSDYGLSIRVDSDPGRPLTGAQVKLGDKKIGVTGQSGVVKAIAHGAEGDVLSFEITCPEGYQSPSRPLAVVLRRLSEKDRVPEYVAECRPTERTLVVAVRAEHGPNLPVMYLGREVARTDRSGAAHLSLRSPPEETVELSLDTSSNPRLRPHEPSARFRVGQADDLVVLDENFQLEGGGTHVVRAVHKGPVRIGRGGG
ncbi:MAG TPA: hypothetical protein VH062_24525 [Polyangiaceae bacterium]|jgi:hypothetical protein|nr:hypothetical protein [Polyangiaceae bacterium]